MNSANFDRFNFDLRGKLIFVAGHKNMLGSAIARKLTAEGADVLTVHRRSLDLRDQAAVYQWLDAKSPDAVILAAANAVSTHENNMYPANIIFENLMIQANIIHCSHLTDVERLLFVSPSCIYPELANQPTSEEELLSGPFERATEFYALAKIAGIKLCDAYRKQYGRSYVSSIISDLYGPGDNFALENDHIIPTLVRKLHAAKVTGSNDVSIGGTATLRHEILHVDDVADALFRVLKNYDAPGPINVASGRDFLVIDLARMIAEVADFNGQINADPSVPHRQQRNFMDNVKISNLGWKPSIFLHEGLAETYEWFLRRAG